MHQVIKLAHSKNCMQKGRFIVKSLEYRTYTFASRADPDQAAEFSLSTILVCILLMYYSMEKTLCSEELVQIIKKHLHKSDDLLRSSAECYNVLSPFFELFKRHIPLEPE